MEVITPFWTFWQEVRRRPLHQAHHPRQNHPLPPPPPRGAPPPRCPRLHHSLPGFFSTPLLSWAVVFPPQAPCLCLPQSKQQQRGKHLLFPSRQAPPTSYRRHRH